MSKYFIINGYWKDDESEFQGMIVKEFNDIEDNDDDIFFYGLNEYELQKSIDSNGENDSLDFVVTSFNEVQ